MAKVKYDELGRKDITGGNYSGTAVPYAYQPAAYVPATANSGQAQYTKPDTQNLAAAAARNNQQKANANANGAIGVIAGAPNLNTGANGAAGVLAGATAATAAAAKNGNSTGGGSGGGTGAAAVSPNAQAAASGGSSQTSTPAAAQVTGQYPVRPANEEYNPSQAVMDAQTAMQGAQAGKPGAYTPSAQVMSAQMALQNLQDRKPQGYTSKYGPQLEALLEQIQNPGQFRYEFNGDNLFKMYADEYTQRGKQASMDAMGQAAAMTGGYGNSYAQQVANQAYDQNLTELYDRGMELRDRAYEAWLNEQQDLYNRYALLNDAENTDYNRYRDTVGDWQNERGYLSDMYNNERNFDYGTYQDQLQDYYNNLNYYTGRYDTERSTDYGMYGDRVNRAEEQYQYDTGMNEKIREFNESLDYEKMSDQQKYAADYAMNILAMGQMPSAEMLKAAGLSAVDAAKLMAKIAPTVTVTGGGSGNNGAGNSYYVDDNGVFYSFDSKGNVNLVDPSTLKDNDLIDTSRSSKLEGTKKVTSNTGKSSASGLIMGLNTFINSAQDEKKKK